MTIDSRRDFIIGALACGGSCIGLSARAQAPAKVAETDAQAVALGYKADTSKVDAKKYPNHAAAQSCATCSLYQGKAKEPSGPCPLFAGKSVEAAGWCSAWVKKA